LVSEKYSRDFQPAICQTTTSSVGFETICLQNAFMSVSILPQLGGKICELSNLQSGRNWLWRNPYIPLRLPGANLDYEKELDSGGWDEILFSVKPCTVELPDAVSMLVGDHGNVVDKAWDIIEAGITESGDAVCDLQVKGTVPDFSFRRRIKLHAKKAQLDFEYTLVNTGLHDWPWLWCPHPLIAIDDGMKINIPGSPEMLQEKIQETGARATHKSLNWPVVYSAKGDSIDLKKIFEMGANPKSFYSKVFVRSGQEISISNRDDTEHLQMNYSPKNLPWLGLWLNKMGWSGCGSPPYLNLGIEPTTTPYDSLAHAFSNQQADILQAGETATWRLSVQLRSEVGADV
jgi:galactose mutarotase-like enzyme